MLALSSHALADEDSASAAAMLDDIEDILADGIARVTIRLKYAKR